MQGKDPTKESKEESKSSRTCPECNKIFPSEKSLYGHMRWHPSRNHPVIHHRSPEAAAEKSISSPTNSFPREPTDSFITSAAAAEKCISPANPFSFEPTASVITSGAEAEKSSYSPTNSFSGPPTDSIVTSERTVAFPELTRALPHWKVTAPRGRKPACRDLTGGLPRDSQTKAHDNMDRFATLIKAIRFVEGEKDDDDDDDAEDYYAGDGYDYEDFYRKNLNKLGELKEQEKCKEEFKRKTNDQAMNGAREGKYIKKRKGKDIVQVIDSTKYKCNICGRGFPSHQALGGHKTIHRMGSSSSRQAVHGKMDGASCSKGYACKTCGKKFSTGRALGGHQRLHFYGDLKILPASPAEQEEEAVTGGQEEAASSPEPEEEVVAGGRRVLNFDLNELPPSEEEEEGADEER